MKKIALSLIATLALADSLDDGLTHLNLIRKSVGLNELSINSILQTSAYNHSFYLISNNISGHYEDKNYLNFTGITPQDRAVYAGYNNYGVSENIASGTDGYVDAIDWLMSAIYHRFGFLGFDIDEIGFEKYESENYAYKSVYTFNMGNSNIASICSNDYGEVLGKYYYDVCSDKKLKIPVEIYDETSNKLKIANPKVITYPYDGQLDFMPLFNDNESPDPTPNLGISGNPISIQFNDYYMNEVSLKEFKLYDSNDNEVATQTLTSQNDVNKLLTSYQFVLFPIKRLEWNSYYKIKANFLIDKEEFSGEYTFKTKALDYPELKLNQDGQTLKVEQNKEYAVSVNSDLIEKIGLLNYQTFSAETKCNIDYIDTNTLKVSTNNKCQIKFSNNVSFNLEIAQNENKTILTVNQGWNLLALVTNQNVQSSTFSDYKAIYTYANGSWQKNPSTIKYGLGFWIYSNTTKNYELTGNSYKADLNNLNSGWNLLGSGENTTIDNLAWIYDGSWQQTKNIKVGQGFWVKK